MSKIKNIAVAALTIWAALSIPAQLAYATTTDDGTVTNAVSDSAITASVKAKYLMDSQIKGLDVHVKTVNGKVILTGKVPNATVEEHAVAVALNTEGVKEVISRLKLK